MRGRTWIITAAVIAVGAVPAAAGTRDQALRKAPVVAKPAPAAPAAPVVTPARPATPARPVVVTPAKPAAVWIPSPRAGIKWNVRFR